MPCYTIITNNPKVRDYGGSAASYIDGTVSAVLTAARDAVHKGALLISHPQSGSLRPGLNPYKSIVISHPKPTLDFNSLQLMEKALLASVETGTAQPKPYPDQWLDDFQTVDLDFVMSALAGLPAAYC